MNQCYPSSIAACFAALLLFLGCSSVDSDKKKAIALNDEATIIQMKVVSNEWPIDSLERAVELYQESIEADSTNGVAYHNLYNSLVLAKKYEDAEDVCSEWINSHPNDYTFRLRRANLQLIQGKRHPANAEYARIGEYLDNLPPLKIREKMDQTEIEEAVLRANNIFIVKDDSAAALSILQQLQGIYPDIQLVNSSIENISSNSRDEYLRRTH